jgi:hypothetical protein
MTLDDILGAAAKLAVAERLPTDGDVPQGAVLKWHHRLEHLLNMMYAVELKELELLEMRKALRYKTAPEPERLSADAVSLRRQISDLIRPPRW